MGFQGFVFNLLQQALLDIVRIKYQSENWQFYSFGSFKNLRIIK